MLAGFKPYTKAVLEETATQNGQTLEDLLKENNITDLDAYIDEYVEKELAPRIESIIPEIPPVETFKYEVADGKIFLYEETIDPEDFATYTIEDDVLTVTPQDGEGDVMVFTRQK